ncbi:MAG: ABC transporter ATP-binding protein [Chloroflexota bacterium]|nr:ABC transporter ATP-binding protein [Chloroflexota bacterium]
MSILELRNVHTYYGNIHALKGVSLQVEPGEIVTLIGSNGAGKSTALNTICGLLQPRQGEVWLEGNRIDGVPAHEVVKKGVCQAPEGRKIFGRLTVMENLEMGAFTRSDKQGIKQDIDRVFSVFPRLGERRKQVGGTLSGGEQQMLAIGRALMASPKLLLLDEPSMGLAPMLVEEIFNVIEEINDQGTTVLLVEQNAAQALQVAQRGYVIETGEIVLQGPSKDLLDNPRIKEAYLGA